MALSWLLLLYVCGRGYLRILFLQLLHMGRPLFGSQVPYHVGELQRDRSLETYTHIVKRRTPPQIADPMY